jgi:hypothetical protein
MVVGDLVIFDAEEIDFAQALFFIKRGLDIPMPGETICKVSWIGEHEWNGNKRDIRMCIKLEEYGESCIFPIICWRKATQEEQNRGYYAEFEVVDSFLHS